MPPSRRAARGALAAYRGRLVRLTTQLQRVNAALAAWDAYEANRHLPSGLRRYVPRPEVTRETPRDPRAILLGALDEWEGGWLRRN